MTSKFKSFQDLQVSLRAGAASGMNTQITLEPDSAIFLADILQAFDLMAQAQAQKEAEDDCRR